LSCLINTNDDTKLFRFTAMIPSSVLAIESIFLQTFENLLYFSLNNVNIISNQFFTDILGCFPYNGHGREGI